jgi:hypothetical protein
LPLKAVKAKRHFEPLLSDATLRGGVERAAHLPRNALHGAGAYAEFAGIRHAASKRTGPSLFPAHPSCIPNGIMSLLLRREIDNRYFIYLNLVPETSRFCRLTKVEQRATIVSSHRKPHQYEDGYICWWCGTCSRF